MHTQLLVRYVGKRLRCVSREMITRHNVHPVVATLKFYSCRYSCCAKLIKSVHGGRGMPYSDKMKQREYQRDFMRRKTEANPKWHAELVRRKDQNRQVVRDIVSQIKRTFGCLLCNEQNPENLQFHHVLPDMKLASVSDLICNRSKLIVILKEIDKCVCVCNSCHQRLESDVQYLIGNIKEEKWFKDWGIQEALEWSSIHPQSRIKRMPFIAVIKAVARNCQIQDSKSFQKVK